MQEIGSGVRGTTATTPPRECPTTVAVPRISDSISAPMSDRAARRVVGVERGAGRLAVASQVDVPHVAREVTDDLR